MHSDCPTGGDDGQPEEVGAQGTAQRVRKGPWRRAGRRVRARGREARQQRKQREEALRYKACERKKRYASEAEAKDAIRSCERHGSRDLHCYRCPYCNGWHLTHK